MVHITGYGRSGSTVLDGVLGSHPRACSLGELAHLVRAAWLGEEYCACGQRARECAFWRAVLARWIDAGGDPAGYARLQDKVEGGRGPILACLAGRRPRGAAYEAWGRATVALLAAIRAESGAAVLIDSSKSPARALALSGLAEIDLFVVHLVRDARGVAWSLARPFAADARAGLERPLAARSVARTALAWNLVNRACERVVAALAPDRQLRLRYEAYVSDLGGALEPLEPFVGAGLVELARAFEGGRPLAPGHAVAGNRLRLAGAIALSPDTRWREAMSGRQQARVGRLAGSLLRRYGYER